MGINNLLAVSFNWNLFITIISYVLIVGVLITGALKGMKRGLVRSGVRLIFLIAFIVVAALITTPISKALLGIDGTFMNVEYNGEICKTIGEAVKGLILSQEEIANIANNSPSVMAIIEGLPVALANIVVFFLLCWIMRLFSFIVYVIIDRTAIKSSKLERQQKKQRKLQKKMEKKGKVAVTQSQIVNTKPKHKLLGALVGAVQAFVLLFLFLLPINSLVGVVADIKASSQAEQTAEEGVYADGVVVGTVTVNEEENLNESVYDILKNLAGENIMSYFDSYNDSYAVKALKLGGLSNTAFDELTKIETPNGVVKIRSDAISFVNSYDELMRVLSFNGEDINWKDADFSKLKVVVEKVLDSDLLSSVVPEIAPYVAKNYLYEMDFFNNLAFSNELKTELNSVLDEYKEEGFMTAFKADLFTIFDLFAAAKDTDFVDKIYNGGTISEIVTELTKNDNELFNVFFDTLYNCKILNGVTIVGLNYANDMFEDKLELETDLQAYTKQTLFAESEKQSFKDVLLAVLKNIDVISNLQSIEDLTEDDISTLSTLLTSLQNNAFKNYSNGTLVARENAVLNKETLTVQNGGAFSNLYLTLVNYVLGDYVPNINYKNADWQNVLTSVYNLVKSESDQPSVSDVMAILSLDEDIGEAAKNIYDAFSEIDTNDGLTNEEISTLLTTVSTNIENLGEEKVDEIINKISEKVEIPEIKENISYEIIMQEKEGVEELANLFKTQSDNISTDVLEKIADSELIVEQVAKFDVQIVTEDVNIANKIEELDVSESVKANLKSIFGIGE